VITPELKPMQVSNEITIIVKIFFLCVKGRLFAFMYNKPKFHIRKYYIIIIPGKINPIITELKLPNNEI